MEKSEQPAFPFNAQEGNTSQSIEVAYYGITKREYFAALALQGMLANLAYTEEDYDHIAIDVFSLADVMIEASKS